MTGTSSSPQSAGLPFTMLGTDGVVCDGDACILPGADESATD